MRFPFFSKDFRGSAKRQTLAFFGVSLAVFFPKKQGLEGQGRSKSGPGGGFGGAPARRGISGWNGPAAPPESLEIIV